MNFMTSTSRSEISPSVALETPEHMRKETVWTLSLRCDSDTQSSSEDEQVNPVVLFNEAMKTLSQGRNQAVEVGGGAHFHARRRAWLQGCQGRGQGSLHDTRQL